MSKKRDRFGDNRITRIDWNSETLKIKKKNLDFFLGPMDQEFQQGQMADAWRPRENTVFEVFHNFNYFMVVLAPLRWRVTTNRL